MDVWVLTVLSCVCAQLLQLCLTLCDPMDCSLPGSSVRGILKARILELVAIPFSRESSQFRDWTGISCVACRFFTAWATRETLDSHFANKGPCSQSYGFSSTHLWMCELDHKESWDLKNWCFLIVVLEKTLEIPLDNKEIKSVNPKEIKPEYSLERLMLKLLKLKL